MFLNVSDLQAALFDSFDKSWWCGLAGLKAFLSCFIGAAYSYLTLLCARLTNHGRRVQTDVLVDWRPWDSLGLDLIGHHSKRPSAWIRRGV